MPDDEEPELHICVYWPRHNVELHINLVLDEGADPIAEASAAVATGLIIAQDAANANTRSTSIQ